MSKPHSWWKVALAAIGMLVATQIAVSLAVRTDRVHNYLAEHLETAFGRPVQVRHFNVEIFPSPRIYATGVTVGEDPAFGYEYFLRAEHLTAGLRWSGFFRGHFEFGTLYLGQPSLTLVRNDEGRWNLEGWLPPAKTFAPDLARTYGPSRAPAIANRLQRIEFDDGRINFKRADIKAPFALTGVNGNVDQIASGRWKLQLEAQPWRSGVALQSTGTLKVQGDIAGTSVRLRPASFSVHWDSVSLADLFRLLHGQDYGVRGTFALDATARSGELSNPSDRESHANLFGSSQNNSISAEVASADSAVSSSNDWIFSVKARAAGIHRWDLTERSDNPKLTATIQGRWDVAFGKIVAQDLRVETPVSNVHGTARFSSAGIPYMQVSLDSLGIQSSDILSWYRAFQPNIADGIVADEFSTGTLAVQGWPLKLQELNLSTSGGVFNIPGVEEALAVSPFHASLDHMILATDPIRLHLIPALTLHAGARGARVGQHRVSETPSAEIALMFAHDFNAQKGTFSLQGHATKSESVLRIASAFGHTLNHGWDLSGPARADLRREWLHYSTASWNGFVDVSDAQLAAAGLNQPLQLQQARLEWRDGKRTAQIVRAEGFGAIWTGNVAEDTSADPQRNGIWNVQLHADRLDATELDRWVGPRARPGWLQKLLPSLFTGAVQAAAASELVRRLDVSGELLVDEFTIEKLQLEQLRVRGALHDLHLVLSDGQAQWAGGTVHATMNAEFIPRPLYEVKARLTGVDLTKLTVTSPAFERLAGIASGTVRLKTAGVGREELLEKLTGSGAVHLADVEFRGWDISASVADGEAHPGSSRWPSGAGTFTVRNRSVLLQDVHLDRDMESTLINGSVTFKRDADLAVETGAATATANTAARKSVRGTAAPVRVLKIVGPLDDPRISTSEIVSRQPAD
ncbi:MAG: AsmA family protein [Acidobacteriota bacterium]|nr:AsmA family protein [Acidobacteriota bacterium]